MNGLVRPITEDTFPDGTITERYRFVHALYQNAFYASLAPARKASLSGAVAEALLGCYGDQGSRMASELALLFEAARDPARACEQFCIAAQNASRIFAYQEAIALARRGLGLVPTMAESPERAKRELSLQVALSLPLMVIKGWGSPELLSANARALQLCHSLGNAPELFEVLWGVFAFHVVRAEHRNSRTLADRLLFLARRSQDRAHLVMAHWALTAPSFYQGDFVSAREQLEKAFRLYDPREHGMLKWVYAQDPAMGCLAYSGWTLWYLGYPDQARAKAHEASAYARKLSHPFSLAYALLYEIYLYSRLRDAAATRERMEEILSLAEEYDFNLLHGMATIVGGWTAAQEGERESGTRAMRRGLAAVEATGSRLLSPYHLALLAEEYKKAGDLPEAKRLVAEAMDVVLETDERCHSSELYRIDGELLSMSDDLQVEPEDRLRQAIEIARGQSAKSLELRAAVSLSRLWQRQGRREEAHQLLTSIYGWFTEGFDTADLKEAKAIIDES